MEASMKAVAKLSAGFLALSLIIPSTAWAQEPDCLKAQKEAAASAVATEEDVCKPLAAGKMPVTPPGQKPKKPKKNDPPEFVPLDLVVCEVQRALDAYQGDADVKDGKIPKLATADFEYKTVLDTKLSFSINILVFKFGASYDNQTTHDLDFQYQPKSRVKTITKGPLESVIKVTPVELQDDLICTIKAAAKAKQLEEEIPKKSKDPLVFKQFSITVAYGVTWDVNASASIPIHIITLGPGIDHSKNTVQSVKLVFDLGDAKPAGGAGGGG
jgi:hypothetical protein